MNKLHSAILLLAVLELLICCFFMPVFLFRMQERELSKEVNEEKIISTSLLSYENNLLQGSNSGMSLEKKMQIANSYDNSVSSIYLEKGEKYTANQICSIAAIELEKIASYYQEDSELMKKLLDMNLSEPIRQCGIFLEQQNHTGDSEGIGYADVETVDEVDTDLNSLYINNYDEVHVEALMYINSSEPDEAFIVWQINYYNMKEDTTLFILFDDETGKMLSITGSISDFNNEVNYSLYKDSMKNAALFKEYYEKEDKGTLYEGDS